MIFDVERHESSRLLPAVAVVVWRRYNSMPLLINRYYHSFRQAIQCPGSGDCYTPGSEHLLGIELLIAFSAFTVWPLFIWYVVVQPWRARVVARRSKAALLVSEPRANDDPTLRCTRLATAGELKRWTPSLRSRRVSSTGLGETSSSER